MYLLFAKFIITQKNIKSTFRKADREKVQGALFLKKEKLLLQKGGEDEIKNLIRHVNRPCSCFANRFYPGDA